MLNKPRIALLGLLALFVASGIMSSSASAFGPYWHVNGARLESGGKQLNMQIKGNAVLRFTITSIPVTIECTNASAEGAAIEGNGTSQGQDKGRLTFSACTVSVAKCKMGEPITTNNLKSHLVTFKGSQSKYADLFEARQGETLFQIKIQDESQVNMCPTHGEYPVKGLVAAEVVPKEMEGQEGLLNFPTPAIALIFQENVEKKIGLFLGVAAAKFAAAFSAKLITGEKWGVFGQ